MRRPIRQIAALLVAGVFLSLPTLARLHDHVSVVDNASGFRLSKNIQRPSERHCPVAVSPVLRPRVVDAPRGEDVPPMMFAFEPPSIVTPASVRAPPRANPATS